MGKFRDRIERRDAIRLEIAEEYGRWREGQSTVSGKQIEAMNSRSRANWGAAGWQRYYGRNGNGMRIRSRVFVPRTPDWSLYGFQAWEKERKQRKQKPPA